MRGNKNIKKFGFGSRTKEFDDAARAKARGVPKKRVWTKSKCVEELEFILGRLKKILIEDEKVSKGNTQKLKAESVRDLNNMMGRILQFMQYLYPPIQQNLNVNIDATASVVMERLKEFKLKELNK